MNKTRRRTAKARRWAKRRPMMLEADMRYAVPPMMIAAPEKLAEALRTNGLSLKPARTPSEPKRGLAPAYNRKRP